MLKIEHCTAISMCVFGFPFVVCAIILIMVYLSLSRVGKHNNEKIENILLQLTSGFNDAR